MSLLIGTWRFIFESGIVSMIPFFAALLFFIVTLQVVTSRSREPAWKRVVVLIAAVVLAICVVWAIGFAMVLVAPTLIAPVGYSALSGIFVFILPFYIVPAAFITATAFFSLKLLISFALKRMRRQDPQVLN